MLFPFEKKRKYQDEMIRDIQEAVDNNKVLLIHAPTGIGKTVASLSSILPYVLNSELKLFFVTSKNIQHKIVVETIEKIEEKFDIKIPYQELIGKKNLCLKAPEDVDIYEFCRLLRKENKCEFFINSKNKIIRARNVIDLIEYSKKEKVCPYEMALKNIRNSKVIIGNYNHLFNLNVRNYIFSRGNLTPEDLIVVVDEAQNLPDSISKIYSKSISIRSINLAIKEMKKYGFNGISYLEKLRENLKRILKEERKVDKDEIWLENLDEFSNYGDMVREEKGKSYIGSVADFFYEWDEEKEGFVRISFENKLQYVCLDPSFASNFLNEVKSAVLMSGTFKPLRFYRDLLGIKNYLMREYKNPFPIENRKIIIIPRTTTKYSCRNEEEFSKIGKEINNLIKKFEGGGIVFFSSYEMLNNVLKYIKINRKFFVENKKMSQIDKVKVVEGLKSGGVLFGVIGSNFSEGVDVPNSLEFVLVVGLPLLKPDILVKSKIEYFEKKFGKGFEYGYLLPSMNRIRQAIGRLIRSEKDKGTAVFIDRRYVWKRYRKFIPDDWNVYIKF